MITLPCAACHRGGTGNTNADCYACHRGDFEAAREPNHTAANFPTTCQTCHGSSAWQPATFDHNRSAFPLEGAHRNAACTQCHKTGYSGTAKDCFACHGDVYRATRDPNHVQLGMPTACSGCHAQTAWRPAAAFDHSRTAFPLTGSHTATTCTSCHQSGYSGTSKDCYACHSTDYKNARPNHTSARYPTTCQNCHSTTRWAGATFNHTAFPLTGAHVGTTCDSCHRNGYAGTPKDCNACHATDYQKAQPNHVSAGFPVTCQNCHSTTQWAGATFNHSTTQFPLTGAHVGTTCDSCHRNGYAGTPKDCNACHATDYQKAQPNHVSAGFPLTCQSCHTTTRWSGATFDHDGRYFPIYSGRHRGEWSSCSTCHISPGNFAAFECINCHEHNRTDMDREHRGRSGYSYSSAACYRCHPTGRGD